MKWKYKMKLKIKEMKWTQFKIIHEIQINHEINKIH